MPSAIPKSGSAEQYVVVGKVAGLYGVRGGLKILSYTDPPANLLNYVPWYVRRGSEWIEVNLAQGREHGAGLVVTLQDCTDRDEAAQWLSAEIAVKRDQLPEPKQGEYYWADLIGMQVRTTNGVDLGTISHLFETGANDVLVVKGERERLIPFVPREVVQEVSLARKEVIVDWDPDF